VGVQQILAACAAGAAAFEIFTRSPNTQAFTALTDRAFDKPREQVEVTGDDSGPLVIRWKE
jgi:hypothetical protein